MMQNICEMQKKLNMQRAFHKKKRLMCTQLDTNKSKEMPKHNGIKEDSRTPL